MSTDWHTADVVRLRLEGRWREALDALSGRDDVDARLERLRILGDEHLFGRDRSAEIDDELAAVAAVADETGDAALRAFVLTRRGLALHVGYLADRSRGEPPEELPSFEQALALRQELGDREGVAESLFHIGLVHQLVRGDDERARGYFRESYAVAEEAGDELMKSYAVRHIAAADETVGDLEAARRGFAESLALRERAGWRAGTAAAQVALAAVLRRQGRRDEARALAEQAVATFEEIEAVRALSFMRDALDELLAD